MPKEMKIRLKKRYGDKGFYRIDSLSSSLSTFLSLSF
jgi:hypothetical protein